MLLYYCLAALMNDALELLYTGDLHLGRHPSRIPDDLDGPELSPKAVWLSTVQEAIDRDVDAVVIAGDVVDQENRYFEAYARSKTELHNSTKRGFQSSW